MVNLDTETNFDQVITQITVHNRQDMYVTALSYSRVEVLDGNMNTVFSEELPGGSNEASWTFNFDTPVVGRFMRIQTYLCNSHVAIAEVVVIGFPTKWNVARSPFAVASQSSTCAYGNDSVAVASRAIDGDTSGVFGSYTYTCQSNTKYQW